MEEKRYILLLMVGLFSLLCETQAGTFNLTDSSGLKSFNFLKIDKNKPSSILKTGYFKDLRQKTETVVHAPIIYIENSPLADCYRSQPGY